MGSEVPMGYCGPWGIVARMIVEWKVPVGTFDNRILLTLQQAVFPSHQLSAAPQCLNQNKVVWCMELYFSRFSGKQIERQLTAQQQRHACGNKRKPLCLKRYLKPKPEGKQISTFYRVKTEMICRSTVRA